MPSQGTSGSSPKLGPVIKLHPEEVQLFPRVEGRGSLATPTTKKLDGLGEFTARWGPSTNRLLPQCWGAGPQ